MSSLKFAISDDLRTQLGQLLETNRSDLATRYQQALRETLFNGRSTVRPSMLKTIAADEVDAFADFLRLPEPHAIERGVQLHESGLSEQPVLRLGQVTRQFFVAHLETKHIAPALEMIDAYQEQIIQGFVQSLEKAVFTVQERTRHAFERVANRDKP